MCCSSVFMHRYPYHHVHVKLDRTLQLRTFKIYTNATETTTPRSWRAGSRTIHTENGSSFQNSTLISVMRQSRFNECHETSDSHITHSPIFFLFLCFQSFPVKRVGMPPPNSWIPETRFSQGGESRPFLNTFGQEIENTKC